jgi:two-component system sensor histidine kinase PilS (NtrC family)
MDRTAPSPALQPSPARFQSARTTWHPLYLFNVYRLVLSGLFSMLALWGNMPRPLGEQAPGRFLAICLLYLLFALLSGMTIHLRRPAFCKQVLAQMLVDIAVLTLLMAASGGLDSGLGLLMVVSVAGGSLLIETRTAYLFASVATLAMLGVQAHTFLTSPSTHVSFTLASLYGTVFFATTFLARYLAKRVQETEALARRRGADIAGLEKLNEYIIQQLQSGILVLTPDDTIHLRNATATRLLGLSEDTDRMPLAVVFPELADALRAWRNNPASPVRAIDNLSLLPHFTALGAGQTGTLIVLEDAAAISDQAQQMNLASLGRLTAGIAHEIRNPLAAISHAAQLLGESERLRTPDRRLTHIVVEHARRMNRLIENVLQLSRRDRTRPEHLDLAVWLQQFAEEFRHIHETAAPDLSLDLQAPRLPAYVDPGQLHQVLWNLCINVLDHHENSAAPPAIRLRCQPGTKAHTTCLEVEDRGTPIPPETARQIFEPFFTTRRKGTGLGLYIAREICQANRATLTYQPLQDRGNRFRIVLPDQPPQEAHG